MKKWKTPKAIASKKKIDIGLAKLGKSLGLDKLQELVYTIKSEVKI